MRDGETKEEQAELPGVRNYMQLNIVTSVPLASGAAASQGINRRVLISMHSPTSWTKRMI
jgi:hypothetical protein